MADPVLAKLMHDYGPRRAPMERIVMTDLYLTAFNTAKLKTGERLAVLACGHTVKTKALNRCACDLCHEMIVNGEDYDAFRNRVN